MARRRRRRIRSRVKRARKTVKRKVTRARKTVKRKVAKRAVRKTTRKTTRKATTARIRSKVTTKISRARKAVKSRVSRARKSVRKTRKIAKRIKSANKPSVRLAKTTKISTTLSRWRAKLKLPKTREGKKKGNAPAIWESVKSKLPKFNIKLPEIKIPSFAGVRIGLLGIKAKIPELGFPKFPIPNPSEWMKGKVSDVADSVKTAVDNVVGVATEYKEKRERKSMIKKIVLGLVLAFLALLIWKKAK